MVLESVLNPLFAPLLALGSLPTVIILSLLLSFVVTMVYKYFTDQKMMKSAREEVKQLQKDMKQHKNDPKKMMEIQKRMMERNMQLMKHSFRPTFITFLPLIIIFGWLQGHLTYAPLMPGEQFTVQALLQDGQNQVLTLSVPQGMQLLSDANQTPTNAMATWNVKADAGTHTLKVTGGEESFSKDVVITTKQNYLPPSQPVKGKVLKAINVMQNKLIVMNLFGWKLGWLGSYIIFSLIFSMGLRKLLKVY